MIPKLELKDNPHFDIIQCAIDKHYPNLNDVKPKRLGGGRFATAYGVGDLCFKITSDYDDAQMSLSTIGKKLKHIVKIHHVFDVSEINDCGFLIISNKLKNLRANSILHNTNKFMSVHEALRDYFKFKTINKSELIRRFKSSRFTDNLISQLVGLGDDLLNLDFRNCDFHNDNVRMTNDGILQLIDLGHLTSNGTVKFKKLT
jgi:hypothetical protein